MQDMAKCQWYHDRYSKGKLESQDSSSRRLAVENFNAMLERQKQMGTKADQFGFSVTYEVGYEICDQTINYQPLIDREQYNFDSTVDP